MSPASSRNRIRRRSSVLMRCSNPTIKSSFPASSSPPLREDRLDRCRVEDEACRSRSSLARSDVRAAADEEEVRRLPSSLRLLPEGRSLDDREEGALIVPRLYDCCCCCCCCCCRLICLGRKQQRRYGQSCGGPRDGYDGWNPCGCDTQAPKATCDWLIGALDLRHHKSWASSSRRSSVRRI